MSKPVSQPISQPLTLPCGATLPNRLAKAAMTEGLADNANRATDGHVQLYGRWSDGGAGLHITGNVMIQRGQLERAGNVVIDGEPDAPARAALERWAAAGTRGGNHLWVQISHAGRQTPKAVSRAPIAPSAIPLGIPGGQFAPPRAAAKDEIRDLIQRFATAARVVKDAGFTGVQVHAAHGYLLSEFLSPNANTRTDMWGGSLENRARFLIEAVRATRTAVGTDFPISVKLNSADFQKGGFGADDAETVAGWLADEGVDLLEISGGTYEQPAMMGQEGLEPVFEEPMSGEGGRASTKAREAYFMSYAKRLREVTKIPLMVTGGFRTGVAMNAAVEDDGVGVIGLARPLVIDPDAPAKLLAGEIDELERWEDQLRIGPGVFGPTSSVDLIRVVNGFGIVYWYYHQLLRWGAGQEPDVTKGVLSAFLGIRAHEARAAKALVR